jgi:PKD repeat protein
MERRTGSPTVFSTAADPSGSQEIVTTDSLGDFSPTAVWSIDPSAAGGTGWDIAADNQASGTIGTFDISDSADDPGNAGFTVADCLPVASFTADVTSGGYPLKVHFTDQSAGTSPSATPGIWLINGTVDSTDPNPIFTYSSEGVYSVKLTVTTI